MKVCLWRLELKKIVNAGYKEVYSPLLNPALTSNLTASLSRDYVACILLAYRRHLYNVNFIAWRLFNLFSSGFGGVILRYLLILVIDRPSSSCQRQQNLAR